VGELDLGDTAGQILGLKWEGGEEIGGRYDMAGQEETRRHVQSSV
jgi:hypothetical protein